GGAADAAAADWVADGSADSPPHAASAPAVLPRARLPSPSPASAACASGVSEDERVYFATPNSRLGPTRSAMIVPLVPFLPSFSHSRSRSSPTTMMLSPLTT